ncbi:hypothetical protein ELI00_37575 [Rhizobium ruizarguesonis]|uniref:hypothetical protein n=1 Tax=Rhizobium ruizarguesonis TaxID=2081791 RepID=UPI00102F90F5|nr:hypothetical protein [Rhizobium ruizarguesonis]TAX63354.1 hypothetical protein ELI00_37575 [Rhizobium ruizarguesonis]
MVIFKNPEDARPADAQSRLDVRDLLARGLHGQHLVCLAAGRTVGKIVTLFKPQECANYFAAAGYDPDKNGRALE